MPTEESQFGGLAIGGARQRALQRETTMMLFAYMLYPGQAII